MENKTIQKWKEEVETYLEDLNKKLLQSEKAKELYYGFEVIDGELKMNPEILFIGINPGAGSKERHYSIRFLSERISYLDYFDNEYNYPLAKETVDIFRSPVLQYKDNEIIKILEKQSVKTNLYHIATDNISDIKKCINQSEYNFNDYYCKCIDFSVSLIKILKPKIVIFEGKSVYSEFDDIFYNVKDTWDNSKEFGYAFYEEENIHFLGYKRNYSNICKKENIAEKLKEIL
ncbi:hypothetical protein KRX57_03245 [Weeksellaceae bacterium TAE3-ERU29]|nr:hypothetical protein [Weeksellaceae bacterium TAE3-ERU29]